MIEETNIFGLKAASLYRCQVYRYFNGLSRLYLAVMKPQQTVPAFFLLFPDVAYFEGPMNWQGADFQIASAPDCIDLMLATGIIGEAVLQFPDAYASITDAARLYIVHTPDRPVRIIAGSVTLLTEIPAGI